ncbi:MAG: Acetolactate synthase, mitochondrial [Stictis urceolatum]|nr:Acetolactate synthase, mitochondrial [Stictis urceolata]
MFRTRQARTTLRHLRSRQSALKPTPTQFSTSPAVGAISPYKNPSQTWSASKDTSKRGKSTAAAATAAGTRPVPSPAFNKEERRNRVHPLQNAQSPPLDDSYVFSIFESPRSIDSYLCSFVGFTGGQIFHEMMLRQDVKHICE